MLFNVVLTTLSNASLKPPSRRYVIVERPLNYSYTPFLPERVSILTPPPVFQVLHLMAHTEWRKPLLSPIGVQKKLFPNTELDTHKLMPSYGVCPIVDQAEKA